MYQLNLSEAQKQLPVLIKAALQGETIFITQENNEPIVQLLISVKIRKHPDICGGRACIANTRLTVWNLVRWHQLGLSDQELLDKYPQLTQSDLDAAWDYYAYHKAEILKDIKENEEIDNLSDEQIKF